MYFGKSLLKTPSRNQYILNTHIVDKVNLLVLQINLIDSTSLMEFCPVHFTTIGMTVTSQRRNAIWV